MIGRAIRSGGKPSVKIQSRRAARPIFIRAEFSSASPSFPLVAKDSTLRRAILHHSERHQSRLDKYARLRRCCRQRRGANIDVNKDPRPPGTHFQGAPMPYFMRIVGGVGMHAGYLPGYPARMAAIRECRNSCRKFLQIRSGRHRRSPSPN